MGRDRAGGSEAGEMVGWSKRAGGPEAGEVVGWRERAGCPGQVIRSPQSVPGADLPVADPVGGEGGSHTGNVPLQFSRYGCLGPH